MKMLGNTKNPKVCEFGYRCCREYNKDRATNGRMREKRAFNSEIQDELVEAGYQLQSLDDYRKDYYSSWFTLEDLDDSNFVIEEIQEMKLIFHNINYYPAA